MGLINTLGRKEDLTPFDCILMANKCPERGSCPACDSVPVREDLEDGCEDAGRNWGIL
jgi:hypothetical protein